MYELEPPSPKQRAALFAIIVDTHSWLNALEVTTLKKWCRCQPYENADQIKVVIAALRDLAKMLEDSNK